MGFKLPDGKKLIIEMSNDGYKSVFTRNKWGDFLNYVQKIGLGKSPNAFKGVVAFLVNEDGAGINVPLPPTFTTVTEADKQRAAELNAMNDVPDISDLPPFTPFGDAELPEGEDDPAAAALLKKVQPKSE